MPYNIAVHIMHKRMHIVGISTHNAKECTAKLLGILFFPSNALANGISCFFSVCMSPCKCFHFGSGSSTHFCCFADKWVSICIKNIQLSGAASGSINICKIDFCWKIHRSNCAAAGVVCGCKKRVLCFREAWWATKYNKQILIFWFARSRKNVSMIKCWWFFAPFGSLLLLLPACLPHTHHESFANSYFCNFNLIDQFAIRCRSSMQHHKFLLSHFRTIILAFSAP